MQIDIDRSKQLVSEAKEVFLTPKAEDILTQLLKLKKDIDIAIGEAKSSAEKILAALNQ